MNPKRKTKSDFCLNGINNSGHHEISSVSVCFKDCCRFLFCLSGRAPTNLSTLVCRNIWQKVLKALWIIEITLTTLMYQNINRNFMTLIAITTIPMSTGSCALAWCFGCLSDIATHHWWKHLEESCVTSFFLEFLCPTPWPSSFWPNLLLPFVLCGASAWALHLLCVTPPSLPRPTESRGFSTVWETELVQWGHASLALPLRWMNAASCPFICISQMDGWTDKQWNLVTLPFSLSFFYRCSSVWV